MKKVLSLVCAISIFFMVIPARAANEQSPFAETDQPISIKSIRLGMDEASIRQIFPQIQDYDPYNSGLNSKILKAKIGHFKIDGKKENGDTSDWIKNDALAILEKESLSCEAEMTREQVYQRMINGKKQDTRVANCTPYTIATKSPVFAAFNFIENKLVYAEFYFEDAIALKDTLKEAYTEKLKTPPKSAEAELGWVNPVDKTELKMYFQRMRYGDYQLVVAIRLSNWDEIREDRQAKQREFFEKKASEAKKQQAADL